MSLLLLDSFIDCKERGRKGRKEEGVGREAAVGVGVYCLPVI